jgi:hypothetical protein
MRPTNAILEQLPVNTAIANNTNRQKLAWTFGAIFLLIDAVYVALCLVPFYANGIYREAFSAMPVRLSDPQYLPPFSWDRSGILMLLALLSLDGLAFIVPTFLPILVFATVTSWRRLKRSERACLAVTSVLSFLLFISLFTFADFVGTWILLSVD